MKRKYPASISHDDAMGQFFRKDPKFAAYYLQYLSDNAEENDGHFVLLAAIRYMAKAQEMGKVAKRAGIPKESLSRMLSPRGNPRLSSFFAVLNAMGLKITLEKA